MYLGKFLNFSALVSWKWGLLIEPGSQMLLPWLNDLIKVLRTSAITVVFLGLKFFPSLCRCVYYQSYLIYYETDIYLKINKVICPNLKLQFLKRLLVTISGDYLISFIQQLVIKHLLYRRCDNSCDKNGKVDKFLAHKKLAVKITLSQKTYNVWNKGEPNVGV